MNIQQLKLTDIKPYDKNPRKNDKAVVTVIKSLEEYGFQQPIVVDKDYVIIVGHTRYRAAKQLGFAQVPVVIADQLTDKQATAYRIMDNRSNENAKWDDALLIEELQLLLQHDTQQLVSEHTGFTEAELAKMFPDASEEEILPDFILKNYKSQTGDVWILGDHRLINGDSTKQEDVKQLMVDDKIDLFWEDPPYGISYTTIGSMNMTEAEKAEKIHKIANDDLNPEQLDAFLDAHLKVVTPYIKAGAPVYWCHDIRFSQQFRELLVAYDFHIADVLIWKKNGSSAYMVNYAKFYEPILYGWKTGKHPWYGSWSPNTIDLEKIENYTKAQLIGIIQSIPKNYQEFDREPPSVGKLHPTVKPTKLVAYHIINSSRVGEIVFDGFAGSGATLLAAEKTGRKARCVEFEPKFCDVIINRWQELTGLQAVRHDGVKWDDIVPENKSLDQIITDNLNTLLDLPEHNDE